MRLCKHSAKLNEDVLHKCENRHNFKHKQQKQQKKPGKIMNER